MTANSREDRVREPAEKLARAIRYEGQRYGIRIKH
jgi:hypothetical protein